MPLAWHHPKRRPSGSALGDGRRCDGCMPDDGHGGDGCPGGHELRRDRGRCDQGRGDGGGSNGRGRERHRRLVHHRGRRVVVGRGRRVAAPICRIGSCCLARVGARHRRKVALAADLAGRNLLVHLGGDIVIGVGFEHARLRARARYARLLPAAGAAELGLVDAIDALACVSHRNGESERRAGRAKWRGW